MVVLAFVSLFFFCSFLPLRNRQRKGKKVEACKVVVLMVTTFPDSLFLNLEEVTLATVNEFISLPPN